MTQPIDTTNASGRLFMQILGAFAEFERELIRERTIAGQERALKEGKRIGRHPLNCICGNCQQSKGNRPKWVSNKWQLKERGGLAILPQTGS